MRRNLAYYLARNAAISAVSQAVYKGDLVRLSQANILCSNCKVRRAVHYDHRDYDKPLEVTPVCASCNAKLGAGKSRYWQVEKETK